VIIEAYLHGVSTQKVDDLVQALGVDTGISNSEVSRICADLDQEGAAFRHRQGVAWRPPGRARDRRTVAVQRASSDVPLPSVP
jgi:hypothetical protein